MDGASSVSSGYSGVPDKTDGKESITQESCDNDENSPALATFLLALLHANNQSPIKGNIMLMKQAFIIVKEIAPNILQEVDFFAYKWGPYSDDVAEVLTYFLEKGLMKISSGRKKSITLSSHGKKVAAQAYLRISPEMVEDIENLKKTTEEVGLKRFLEFIYVNYPIYSSRSWGKEKFC
jgi:uncharacterized protein YwgA